MWSDFEIYMKENEPMMLSQARNDGGLQKNVFFKTILRNKKSIKLRGDLMLTPPYFFPSECVVNIL